MILITNYYKDKNSDRQVEIEDCLQRNLENSHFTKVILVHSPDDVPPANPKIVSVVGSRPTWAELFKLADQNDVNVFSNSDIWFDDTIARAAEIKEKECYCLSRDDNQISTSQDVFIMRGEPVGIKADFLLGVPGTDNKLCYELRRSKYKLFNYCCDIVCHHLHATNIRNYTDKDRLKGPFHFVKPSKMGEPVQQPTTDDLIFENMMNRMLGLR